MGGDNPFGDVLTDGFQWPVDMWVAIRLSLQYFLLGFSALFAIVNPVGAALNFNLIAGGKSEAERAKICNQVASYSLLVMLIALWGGAYILGFFGITISALRIAGGLVITINGWLLLSSSGENETLTAEQAEHHAATENDIAFFPLTLPMTTGPGTISVAVGLGSDWPTKTDQIAPYVLGNSVAAVLIAAVIWGAYRLAHVVGQRLGRAGQEVLGRLMAFILLCIGVQIALSGIEEFVHRI